MERKRRKYNSVEKAINKCGLIAAEFVYNLMDDIGADYKDAVIQAELINKQITGKNLNFEKAFGIRELKVTIKV